MVDSLPSSKVCSNTFCSAHQAQHHPRAPPWRDHRSTCTTRTGMAVLLGSPRATSMDICAHAGAAAIRATKCGERPRTPPPRRRSTSPPPRELPSWCYQARMSALSTDIFAKCMAQIATVPVRAPTPNPQPPGDGRIAGTPRGITVGYFTHSTRAQPHSGWQPARA